jgi:glycosyltransferase involved in cell wall biosynthesis
MKNKILFLGETFRADAQTWMNGLAEYGNFEFITWELNLAGSGIRRFFRAVEFMFSPFSIWSIIRREKPKMVIAERTTSYGFLAAVSGLHPMAVAQQGITDIYPLNSPFTGIKEMLQGYAFKKADLIHAWGPVMAESMMERHVDMSKVMVLPKGINMDNFYYNPDKERYRQKIRAIVTRSLLPDYRHNVIIRAFKILKDRGYEVELLIAGQGRLRASLEELRNSLGLQQEVVFLGRINNIALPNYLNKCNIYISMPITEGVSASLFEAMACGCYPMVTDLPGNRSWIENGVNGHLIPVNDSEALAKCVEKMWQKPEMVMNVAAKNRKFVEEHANYKKNMATIANAYQNLINKYNNQ